MNNYFFPKPEKFPHNSHSSSLESISDHVNSELRQLFANTEFDVEDINIKTLPDKSYRIRICLDKDNSVTFTDLTDLQTEYGPAFDRIISSHMSPDAEYEIDLCSRGVNSPLCHDRHWSRNIGRKVKITFLDNTQTQGRIGKLSEDRTHITIVHTDKSRLSKKNYPLSDISHAVLDVDFREPNPKIIEYCYQDHDA